MILNIQKTKNIVESETIEINVGDCFRTGSQDFIKILSPTHYLFISSSGNINKWPLSLLTAYDLFDGCYSIDFDDAYDRALINLKNEILIPELSESNILKKIFYGEPKL